MTLYVTIQAAIIARAATAQNIPGSSQFAYDGMIFDSTVGTPWMRFSFMPQSGQPFSVSGASKEHLGLFQISLFYPPNKGTGDVDTAADGLKAVFNPGTRLLQGGEAIVIESAQRGPVIQEADWLQVPVTVAYRVISANN